MTVQLDWPPEVVDRLTKEAQHNGLSLGDYVLQALLQRMGSNGARQDERGKREEAANRIAEIRQRVKPEPDGWTSRDYIRYGRR